ncbi:MAG: DUF3467 domain-containing protein [Armatimonadetes bacterium]|nr:DUF3467 domain-containing protein [Armatimonadota bacterium]
MPTEIQLQPGANTVTIYSNYAAVQHTPTDIVVRFCLIDPLEGTVNDENPEAYASIPAKVEANVFLSPKTAEGLVRAIAAQLQKWQTQTEGSEDA